MQFLGRCLEKVLHCITPQIEPTLDMYNLKKIHRIDIFNFEFHILTLLSAHCQ